jgi:hypothetical protein
MEAHDEAAVEALFDERRASGVAATGTMLDDLREVWDSPDAALAVIRNTVSAPGYHSHVELMSSAVLAAHYGDTELSLELLRKDLVDGDIVFGRHALWWPAMAEVRRTDAFEQLMRDIGYEELWRETGRWADFCRPLGPDDFECF